ncbi:hypothetical protein GDO81_028942 [Engystomops pustulosus]|uniref:Uncharacterized protein n=1 Tax=Engystomops pustulosus TaxID=76066 RepID=A0AAV6ZCR6_ENGPU|nr:hypothetical protein GDO81_028942 [Engystomops pustulosus]
MSQLKYSVKTAEFIKYRKYTKKIWKYKMPCKIHHSHHLQCTIQVNDRENPKCINSNKKNLSDSLLIIARF